MKKRILLVIMCLSLVVGLTGCESTIKKVGINEEAKGDTLSVTFTELEIPEDDLGKGSYNLGSSYEYTKEGYVNRLAHFKIKNIGKSEATTDISGILKTGDGHTFNMAKVWYHVDDIYDTTGHKIEGGSWVNNALEITSYDEPVDCIIAFLIPEEVANGTDSLSIIVNFDNQEYTIEVR